MRRIILLVSLLAVLHSYSILGQDTSSSSSSSDATTSAFQSAITTAIHSATTTGAADAATTSASAITTDGSPASTTMTASTSITSFIPVTTTGMKRDVSGCISDERYPGSYSNSAGTYRFEYVVDCRAGTINMTVWAAAQGWVAFSLGQDDHLPLSDVTMGWARKDDPLFVGMQDKWYVDDTPAVMDNFLGGTQDILGPTAYEDENGTTLVFARKLFAKDEYDRSFTGGFNWVHWSFHRTSDDPKQLATHYGSLRYDFFRASVSYDKPPTQLHMYKAVHGSLMVVAWVMFAGVGMILSRYGRPMGRGWMRGHAVFQGLTGIIVIVAFVVIEVEIGSRVHFTSFHQVLGLISVSLTMCQIVVGIFAYIMPSFSFRKAGDKTIPFWPHHIHHWVGRANYLIALINIYLGFYLYNVQGTLGVGLQAVYGVFLFILFVMYVIMERKLPMLNGGLGEVPYSPRGASIAISLDRLDSAQPRSSFHSNNQTTTSMDSRASKGPSPQTQFLTVYALVSVFATVAIINLIWQLQYVYD